MIFHDLENKYPILAKTANYLESNCSFYSGVLKQIRQFSPNYEFGEELCQKALALCSGDYGLYYKNLHSLIYLSLEFLQLQIELERDGKYRHSTFAEVEKNEYNNQDGELQGPRYLWALYFSQFFWVVHNSVFTFFLDHFVKFAPEAGTMLEVPVGAGLFFVYFLKNKIKWIGAGVDIANSSINFTKDVLNIYDIAKDRVELIQQDVNKYQTDQVFDRIMCGEFLEHVEDPVSILIKIRNLLKDNGEVFITAAVWAANSDHIYLYRNADEVRQHLNRAGFDIKKEIIVPVFKGPVSSKPVPLVYAAISTKTNNNPPPINTSS